MPKSELALLTATKRDPILAPTEDGGIKELNEAIDAVGHVVSLAANGDEPNLSNSLQLKLSHEYRGIIADVLALENPLSFYSEGMDPSVNVGSMEIGYDLYYGAFEDKRNRTADGNTDPTATAPAYVDATNDLNVGTRINVDTQNYYKVAQASEFFK